MFKKNEVIKNLKIIDYTHEGLGIAKYNNIAIFIDYAKLGEIVDIKITKVEKSFCYAKLIDDSNRIHRCVDYKKCGGCQIMHLNYDEQLAFKKMQVVSLAEKFGVKTIVDDVERNVLTFGYRNKVQMPFGIDENKKIYTGFYKKRTHEVVNIKYCHLQSKKANEISDYIVELLNEFNESVYDEDLYKGNLRHLFIRESFNKNEFMVVLVCNSNKIKEQRKFVKSLTLKFSEIKSIVINENTRRNNAVLGFKNHNIYNCNYIKESLNSLDYKITPNVFFQVNTNQTQKMYEKIVEYADVSKRVNVMDAYCGTGSISLFLAKKAKSVVGIEIIAPSIVAANENKKLNKIDNVSFICGDVKDNYKDFDKNYFHSVVVDPPRKGLDSVFIETMLKEKPKIIVYVSCNPATLMRDLKILEQSYRVERISPFDMFSQTYHVESVCLLKLND